MAHFIVQYDHIFAAVVIDIGDHRRASFRGMIYKARRQPLKLRLERWFTHEWFCTRGQDNGAIGEGSRQR